MLQCIRVFSIRYCNVCISGIGHRGMTTVKRSRGSRSGKTMVYIIVLGTLLVLDLGCSILEWTTMVGGHHEIALSWFNCWKLLCKKNKNYEALTISAIKSNIDFTSWSYSINRLCHSLLEEITERLNLVMFLFMLNDGTLLILYCLFNILHLSDQYVLCIDCMLKIPSVYGPSPFLVSSC